MNEYLKIFHKDVIPDDGNTDDKVEDNPIPLDEVDDNPIPLDEADVTLRR